MPLAVSRLYFESFFRFVSSGAHMAAIGNGGERVLVLYELTRDRPGLKSIVQIDHSTIIDSEK